MKNGSEKEDAFSSGAELHGVKVGSMKVPQEELSSSHRGPLKALADQHVGGPGSRNPKGMGRSVAKAEMSAEKEKLSKDGY